MKRYLVGGAVRDRLLGLEISERDWLVTGVSAQRLIEQGYQLVGRDFPVFLDPIDREEHALPRAGRDLPEMDQVLEDLRHRDLTINAMALDPDGHLIDPLNGHRDLEQRILRHTPAFFDDPLRILRLARFAARYADLGFTIARETHDAVRERIGQGILQGWVAERVWAEVQRALEGSRPSLFFTSLRRLDALKMIIPELDRLFGVPQPLKHHPENDTGLHCMLALDRAAELEAGSEARFAVLLHDLGKGVTDPALWPRHIAHEKRGIPLVQAVCDRLRVPNSYRDLARLTCAYHTHAHRALELRPKTILRLLQTLDSFRRASRFEQFLLACQADMQGRTGFRQTPYPQADFLREMHTAARSVDIAALTGSGSSGEVIRQQIERGRCQAIRSARETWLVP